MKQFQRMFIWLIAGITLAMVSDLTAQNVQDRSAQVVRMKGNARYSTGGNNWQPLKVGTTIKSGYLIQTAASSYVDIVVGAVARAASSRVIVGESVSYQAKAEQDVIRVQEDS